MSVFHGIQVYEILENGNLLNAIYTNTGLFNNGVPFIDNEIARKKTHDNKGVGGLYDCRYIETNESQVTSCDLEILKYGAVYTFKWTDKQGGLKWEGLGLMAGPNHISVSYVKV